MNETFFQAYLVCALWSSVADDGTPLDKNYSVDDFSPSFLETARKDCEDFWNKESNLIQDDPERAGHDFWLTRNGHGAGFWDGDWPDDVGEILTAVSKPYGEVYLMVNDDGMIY